MIPSCSLPAVLSVPYSGYSTAFIFVGDGEGLLPGVSAVDDGALYDLGGFG